jgi:hypothetical protein
MNILGGVEFSNNWLTLLFEQRSICEDVVIDEQCDLGTSDSKKNGVFWVVTPCGITTQKTPFFIVTAVKTSNLTVILKFSRNCGLV